MKILFVQLGRFGDLVLMTPVFRLIKEQYPNSEVTVLAGRKNYSVLIGNPFIDNIIKFDKSPLKLPLTLFKILSNYYDYWIDPRDHFSEESRILAKIARAKNKIGFNENGMERVFNYGLSIPFYELHHTEIGINSLKVLGIEIPNHIPKPELYFMNNEKFSLKTTKLVNDDKFIFLNISASGNHKMWDSVSWIEFLRRININSRKIILNYMQSEENEALKIKSVINDLELHKADSIRNVMFLISKSDSVITPDTAIVHIAAAFDKPIFALYSGLDKFYSKFHPTSLDYTAVRAEPGDKGIKSITVEKAVNEFNHTFVNKFKN